jgi:DNA-binding HxlR family transcriptional regulator
MAHDDAAFCPASQAINLLQEKWVLHIVRTLLDGPRGFNDLSRAIGGCNTTTLAQRLEGLESLGIVKKTVHSVMPPKTSYGLTPRGVELDAVIQAIDRWARRHLAAEPASDRGLPVRRGATSARAGELRARATHG